MGRGAEGDRSLPRTSPTGQGSHEAAGSTGVDGGEEPPREVAESATPGDPGRASAGLGAPRPLEGWRVIVTRPRHQSAELSHGLEALGASAISCPTIEITPPADGGAALSAALDQIDRYDCIVFTSANAVAVTLSCLARSADGVVWRGWDERGGGRDDPVRRAGALTGALVAAIGPGTTAALERFGVRVDLVPEDFVGEALLDLLARELGARVDRRGRRGGEGSPITVLFPRGERARDLLPRGLRALGFAVEAVDAYATGRPNLDAAALSLLEGATAITFASPSAVEGFLGLAGRDLVPRVVACVGPVTAERARSLGLEVSLEARPHTIAGLLSGLVAYAGQRGHGQALLLPTARIAP